MDEEAALVGSGRAISGELMVMVMSAVRRSQLLFMLMLMSLLMLMLMLMLMRVPTY